MGFTILDDVSRLPNGIYIFRGRLLDSRCCCLMVHSHTCLVVPMVSVLVVVAIAVAFTCETCRRKWDRTDHFH